LTSGSDPAGTFTYAYDALGRATSITHDISGLGSQVVMNHQYDAAGNRTQLAATIGGTADFVTDYTYDALHRMRRIEQHGVSGGNAVAEKRVDLDYDAASQWQSITRYTDLAATKLVATSNYAFDAAGRLTNLDHVQGPTTLAGFSWTYDVASRVTQFTSVADGTVTYNYDNTNQLTRADYDYQSDENYTYDANGNRTNTAYSTGGNNELLSDGTYNYQYDVEGNRTRRTNITYDFQNRRLAKHIDDNADGTFDKESFYVYDGERWQRGHAGDHIALAFDGSGNLTNRYLHGPAVDQILADEQLDEVLGITAP
jgi:YD repeat-containing protein